MNTDLEVAMQRDAIPNSTGDVWEYVSSGPDHSKIEAIWEVSPQAWVAQCRSEKSEMWTEVIPAWASTLMYRMRRKAQMPVIENAQIAEGIEIVKAKRVDDRKHSHYFKPCPYESIDIYRVLEMWGITNPAIQHAIKKLMVPGGRGGKDAEKDLQEAIDSIQRAIEMMREDA